MAAKGGKGQWCWKWWFLQGAGGTRLMAYGYDKAYDDRCAANGMSRAEVGVAHSTGKPVLARLQWGPLIARASLSWQG
eukprot:366341-Chlamydomonas_euryale.AAC.14